MTFSGKRIFKIALRIDLNTDICQNYMQIVEKTVFQVSLTRFTSSKNG